MKPARFLQLLTLTLLISGSTYSYCFEICFNLHIVTKQSTAKSEKTVFAEQKHALLNQIKRLEQAFIYNEKQQCPIIQAKAEHIKHIHWNEAKTYSQPLDQKVDESDKDYFKRKKQEVVSAILELEKILTLNPKINKHDFLGKRPGQLLLRAKKWIPDDSNEQHVQSAIKKITEVLTFFDPGNESMKREQTIQGKYENIDQASAETWKNGVLTLWNDIEAQDVSVETKNMIRFNRTADNQCIDVYSVPKGHSPSRNNREIQNNGEWSQRGGAALSSKLFPRTTAGKGHAIIMTQNIRPNEYRLAHELGHLFIDKRNAHLGKEAKDLMFEKSLGGFYLNQEECKNIAYSLKKYLTPLSGS